MDSHYVHGTDPVEQRRLSKLNALLNRTSLAAVAPRAGERVIDFGSGLGQLTRDFARAAGVPALGIERSEAQREEALRLARDDGEEALLEIRTGDVMTPPLADAEWGTFDLAHARFVLEHVPDPLTVVRHMARAVRPGGRVVVEDDDHDVLRAWPEPPGLYALWRAYIATYAQHGNDPYVGRKLVALLAEAGVSPTASTWLPFGGCVGDPNFPALVVNLGGVLEGARDDIIGGGLVSARQMDDTLETLRRWGQRPDAVLWFARCHAQGVRGR